MINFTERLNKAIIVSATAHDKQKQYRKGTEIPYVIHPYGVMLIAGNATDDEDTLIGCLLHDILEDVKAIHYNADNMRNDFGDKVLRIVQDVSKNDTIRDWHDRSRAYINHLENKACDEAVVVSAADKIHNLKSTLYDLETIGDKVWNRFSTKSAEDQLWWYEEIFRVIKARQAPEILVRQLDQDLDKLRTRI